jgi:hypothetical protein
VKKGRTLCFHPVNVTGRSVKRKSEDEDVEKRQKKINATYNQLLDLAQVSGNFHHLKCGNHGCVVCFVV